MRLYGAIQKVEPQDDGTVRVHGIATSEALDDQGEIVRADAIRAAIPDYMRFPALREMHQLSAAGTTLEAEVREDGTTRIVAHVVDPVAVSKVKNQVYRGFSIGGRVTQREPGNSRTITGLVLNEISLVDRPANPEAVFDCWKAAPPPVASLAPAEACVTRDKRAASEYASSGQHPFNAPIQIWACAVPVHRHLAKADAVKCLTEHAAPAEEARARTATPANTAQDEDTLPDVSPIARMMADLVWLRDAFKPEMAGHNDQSRRPARLGEIIGELCDFLGSLTPEEAEETQDDPERSGSPLASASPGMPGAAPNGGGSERTAPFLERDRSNVRQTASTAVIQPERSRADQVLLDMAYFACNQCSKIGGLSRDGQANMERACDYLQQAGAMRIRFGTAEKAEGEDSSLASPESCTADGPETDDVSLRGVADKGLENQQRGHHDLMGLAHECLRVLTNGDICTPAAKVGARHSRETTNLFKAAHGHLVGAGVSCKVADVIRPPSQREPDTEAHAAAKASTLTDGRNDEAVLVKVLGEVVPALERLSRRVDEIARTPLPPLTMAKGTVSISKQEDRQSSVGSGDPQLSPQAIASALAKMSKEEQTLTLIKASYATPMRVPGSVPDQR